MRLTRLAVDGLRNLRGVVLEPGPGLNLIGGPNGAGKSSLLEAIYLLSCGKSFRRLAGRSLRGEGCAQLRISARIRAAEADHEVRLVHSGSGNHLSWNGTGVQRVSEVARRLPVQVLAQDVVERFRGGAGGRQALLDWGVFHVEPSFHRCWLEYRDLLRQRNRLLKGGDQSTLRQWSERLAVAGETIATQRDAFAALVAAELPGLLEGFRLAAHLELRFHRGWPRGQSLAQTLAASRQGDFRAGHTRFGPHRAEPELRWDGRGVVASGSAGQVKLAVYLLCLAVGRAVERRLHTEPVMIADDIGSAFDARTLGLMLEWMRQRPNQWFVADAAVAARAGHHGGDRVFHVEQGRLVPL